MKIEKYNYKNQYVELLSEDNDFLLFPREIEMDMEAYELYVKALKLDREFDNRKPKEGEVRKMLDMYDEAFYRGIIQAGVNVVRHRMLVALIALDGLRGKGEEEISDIEGYLNHIESQIEELSYIGDPAGVYYQILFDCLIKKNPEDDEWGEFLERMEKLADEGNFYAFCLMDKIYECFGDEAAVLEEVIQ